MKASQQILILPPTYGAIKAVCECAPHSKKDIWEGLEMTVAKYLAWRREHSSHGHNIQVFRDAESGARFRYACDCGAVISGPASDADATAVLFTWSKTHRKHGQLFGECA
jgi:hypothetical protein